MDFLQHKHALINVSKENHEVVEYRSSFHGQHGAFLPNYVIFSASYMK